MTCSTWTMRRPKNWLGKKTLLNKRQKSPLQWIFYRQGGNKLLLVVERGEKIVPRFFQVDFKMSTLPWCSAWTRRSPSPRRRLLRSQSPIPRRWSCLKMFPLWPFLSSGAWENRKTSWSEGAGLHHGREGEDGEQAVQLADGHVQRGHHRGDHDTGVCGSHLARTGTPRQLGRCDVD